MTPKPLVIILHGIFRTAWSMKLYEWALRRQGYDVLNLTYPSLRHDLQKLAEITTAKILKYEKAREAPVIHYVTHSMGGLILRYIFSAHPDLRSRAGRIVMLVPPSQGSEVADFVQQTGWMRPLYRLLFGPAGQQLTTAHAVHHPAIEGQIGIIAGANNSNPFARYAFGDNKKHDGTIGHENMKISGTLFTEVSASHTSILCKPVAIRRAVAFIQNGTFAD